MIKIDVKGDVVDNFTAPFYDFWDWQYTSPAKMQDDLAKAQNQDVELDIASYGGDVFAASEIYTMLNQYPGKVTGVIQGMAASAASVIAEACDHLIISPAGQMMIHKAAMTSDGNADSHVKTANVLSTTDRTIASIYEAKTGKSEAEIISLMSDETYLTAKDAVDQGFADEVMQVGDKVPQVVNGMHQIPSHDQVQEFMNLVKNSKKSSAEPEKQISGHSALFKQKLAILRGE
ncbi:MAG: Clp protease ClpP [Lactobacillus sp.]|jgi:ATP-dependent protease ClpP protease subunit|nr:Clp protease ClpP [Lactobacillus sp.]MCH4067964.1 Clp protease ClpP [Lactobacillus sp.]MCI1303597.1 Clp protease ClpP [Lactobacillus sp.]MCI1329894.1 Clp protease ClpP [Lactobacillus sp.]MCI1399494.1 Clp protease ClpP [Lactobacillus sp.]